MQKKPLTSFKIDQHNPQQRFDPLPTLEKKAIKSGPEPGASNAPRVRVLVADDSAICRKMLVAIMEKAPDIEVVGMARNGAEAVRLVERLKPDLVTMDINMPLMDGYAATRQIMAERPCPIVMISSNYDSDHIFDALKAGALTVLKKPTANDSISVQTAIVTQIKLMADVKVLRRWPAERDQTGKQTAVSKANPFDNFQRNGRKPRLVAIASSTGGPGALATVLRPLPADYPVPILVVQHISEGFAQPFAAWLDTQINLSVRIGKQADEPKPGEVLIAPDDHHMSLNSSGSIILQKKQPQDNICPSANYLFHSVAKVYGATAVGIVLTGMGDDGADGMQALYEIGAYTIAQNKETCVVFGMPAVAIERGAIRQVQPLDQISSTLSKLVQTNQ